MHACMKQTRERGCLAIRIIPRSQGGSSPLGMDGWMDALASVFRPSPSPSSRPLPACCQLVLLPPASRLSSVHRRRAATRPDAHLTTESAAIAAGLVTQPACLCCCCCCMSHTLPVKRRRSGSTAGGPWQAGPGHQPLPCQSVAYMQAGRQAGRRGIDCEPNDEASLVTSRYDS
eukprot:GHVU01084454.1.p1 GENE.GHVU01084454.1~~GHVU01084454.1.p1  ORF type:complete len:174 (+),score=17.29 GHVU01084454.1:124-645(+)